jgi:hypothetical protein
MNAFDDRAPFEQRLSLLQSIDLSLWEADASRYRASKMLDGDGDGRGCSACETRALEAADGRFVDYYVVHTRDGHAGDAVAQFRLTFYRPPHHFVQLVRDASVAVVRTELGVYRDTRPPLLDNDHVSRRAPVLELIAYAEAQLARWLHLDEDESP